jgi:hypothetical protein
LLNTAALFDFVVAEFEGASTIVYDTATTTREVEFHPNRLPGELKALIQIGNALGKSCWRT